MLGGAWVQPHPCHTKLWHCMHALTCTRLGVYSAIDWVCTVRSIGCVQCDRLGVYSAIDWVCTVRLIGCVQCDRLGVYSAIDWVCTVRSIGCVQCDRLGVYSAIDWVCTVPIDWVCTVRSIGYTNQLCEENKKLACRDEVMWCSSPPEPPWLCHCIYGFCILYM